MELIAIIYNILIIGGGLLLVVVFFSFIVYRFNPRKDTTPSGKKISYIKPNIPPRIISNGHALDRLNIEHHTLQPQSIIHQIDQAKGRSELKIIRKQTTNNDHPEKDFLEFQKNHEEKNNGNGSRYTIVNEEIRKTAKQKVVNFYL